MKPSVEPPPPTAVRASERGGARLNFVLVMAVIAALAYVGWQFVPAQYHAVAFRRFEEETLNTAVETGKSPAWIEQQLRENFEEHGVPEDATVKVSRDGKRLEASVRYTRPISLLVTEYNYEFDVTAHSSTYLNP
jgi:hypothetical protein